ncbi:hypothetical protein O997_05195 [Anaplasma phagocytophilum str. MRK]|nr:hypothetical protein O997_05195 [Anaplasma phagocytophilum str. MRK]
MESNVTNSSHKDVALCGGTGPTSGGVANPEYFKEFTEKTLKDDKNWPTSTAGKNNTNGPTPKTNDNAKAVATDLVALNSDEKTIVAGLLAKLLKGVRLLKSGRFLLLPLWLMLVMIF